MKERTSTIDELKRDSLIQFDSGHSCKAASQY